VSRWWSDELDAVFVHAFQQPVQVVLLRWWDGQAEVRASAHPR
jgi:hypothetical protein